MSGSLLHDSAVDVMVAVIQNMVLTKMGERETETETETERQRETETETERQRETETERQRDRERRGGVVVVTLVTVMGAISPVGDGGVTETSSNDLTYNL